MTSTVDKPYGQRRTHTYKNLVLSGEKPVLLDGSETKEESKLVSVGGSTSRLDQVAPKSGIPSNKHSMNESTMNHTSVSQPNLNRIPTRTKSEPRLSMKTTRDQSSPAGTTPGGGEATGRPPSRQKRMLKQPSGSAVSGRSTPVSADAHASGRSTPSQLLRPTSRLVKPGGPKPDSKDGMTKLLPTEEGECERPPKFERKRSNSEIKRNANEKPSGISRNVSKSAMDSYGPPIPSPAVVLANKAKSAQQRSATLNPESRLLSPESRLLSPESRLASPGSSAPAGNGFHLFQRQGIEKETANVSSSQPDTSKTSGTADDGAKRVSGLQAPGQRKLHSPHGFASNTAAAPPPSPASGGAVSSSGLYKASGKEGKEQVVVSGIPGGKNKLLTDRTAALHKTGDAALSEKDSKPSELSRLPKSASLQFSGGKLSAGGGHTNENQKSLVAPGGSGLAKFQPVASGQSGISPATQTPKGARVEIGGGRVKMEERGESRSNSNASSGFEGAHNSKHDAKTTRTVKADKPPRSPVPSGRTRLVKNEKPEKPVVLHSSSADEESPSSSNELLSPLAGGKDNCRISPEGMSVEGQTLPNEPAIENGKNKLENSSDLLESKLIRTADEEEEKTGLKGELEQHEGAKSNCSEEAASIAPENGSMASEVAITSESDIQTPSLSQGSEAATDLTLSSLSLASMSSPPHSNSGGPSSLSLTTTTGPQHPEAIPIPAPQHYSPSTLHTKHTFPAHSSHIHGAHDPTKTASPLHGEVLGADVVGYPSPTHNDSSTSNNHPLRSPLKKEKVKRARSLSPKSSRRIYPHGSAPQSPASTNADSDDKSVENGVPLSALPSTPLVLSRTESPESTKSDTPAFRKPLRSSLRTVRDKDSSSSSVESGKLLLNKVTISPRSSQVVFKPEEAGLHLTAMYSQPTILSPARHVVRGRPSSIGDNYRVEYGGKGDQADKRSSMHSILSEKLDYTEEERFLSKTLSREPDQQYTSTPEVLVHTYIYIYYMYIHTYM